MKVICKKNTAKDLDLKEVTNIFSEKTQYPVKIGEEYIVMGISVYKNKNYVYYLVDDGFRPNWLPYGLFDISDKKLPSNWYVNVIPRNKYPQGNGFYFSGFYELCNDEDYHDALIERESEALDIYFKRKNEVEEWYLEQQTKKK